MRMRMRIRVTEDVERAAGGISLRVVVPASYPLSSSAKCFFVAQCRNLATSFTYHHTLLTRKGRRNREKTESENGKGGVGFYFLRVPVTHNSFSEN